LIGTRISPNVIVPFQIDRATRARYPAATLGNRAPWAGQARPLPQKEEAARAQDKADAKAHEVADLERETN
jgi:hypothetical protein